MGIGGTDPRLTRRTFLGGLGALGLVAACSSGDDGDSSAGGDGDGPPDTVAAPDVPALPDGVDGDPFTLGVASGDPTPEAVILWTRLALDPLDPAGAMPDADAQVAWEVGADEELSTLVAVGVADAPASYAHSVHVDATGLQPDTTYWYRFKAGDHESPVGRTRTAPPAGSSPERLAVAVASCMAWQSGYFGAMDHIAEDDVDLVLFVGDYYYELEGSTEVRPHGLEPMQSLEDFRVINALTKTDESLQAAHAAHPWVITWDDHEVEDNYADDQPGGIGAALNPEAVAEFPEKRAAAYQAFWEHMPLRTEPPVDGNLDLYRAVTWGDLAELSVLDTRQYRDAPPPDSGNAALPRPLGGGPIPDGVFDEDRTMLGAEQLEWLSDRLTTSEATWNVIVQQSIMASIDRDPDDPDRGYSVDSWDGFIAERNALLGLVADEGVENVVSLAGDLHTNVVADLLADYQEGGEAIGTEIVGTSVSAIELLPDDLVEGARQNEVVKHYDPDHRGYVRVVFEPEQATVDLLQVETTEQPETGIEVGSTWVIESGTAGATEA